MREHRNKRLAHLDLEAAKSVSRLRDVESREMAQLGRRIPWIIKRFLLDSGINKSGTIFTLSYEETGVLYAIYNGRTSNRWWAANPRPAAPPKVPDWVTEKIDDDLILVRRNRQHGQNFLEDEPEFGSPDEWPPLPDHLKHWND